MKPIDHVLKPTSGTLWEGVNNFFGTDDYSQLQKRKEELIQKRAIPAMPKTPEAAHLLYKKAITDIKQVQDITFWMDNKVKYLGQFTAILKLVQSDQKRFYGSVRKFKNNYPELDKELMALLSRKHSLELVAAARNELKRER